MQVSLVKILPNTNLGVKLKKLSVIVLLSLLTSLISSAQTSITPLKSRLSKTSDTLKVASDSTSLVTTDSTNIIQNDTLSQKDSLTQIPISKDAIDQEITFYVPDSAIVNMPEKEYTFYGENVKISMDDVELEAPKVIYRQDSSAVYAYSTLDSSSGLPQSSFTQGEENFKFGEIVYNTESKKAMVVDARSQYDEGYIYSDKIKRNPDNTINGLENVYTTCSAPDPHFSIVSNKIKIIPDRVVVSGPARLEIAAIPTPLILPFALFPLSKGQKSGFILPTYDVSENNGVGLRGMGYYLAINDYMDLKLVGNIYSYGTWLADISSAYVKKYRHNGKFSLSTGNTIQGDRNTDNYSESRTFRVDWVHTINPNILRGYNFSADVHFVSPQFYRNNSYNNELFVQNSTNSNISLRKSWKGKPYNFSLNLRHSQNNNTHEVDLTLPSFMFNVSQQAPFKRKVVSTSPKWYEQIKFSYTLNANNRMAFIDSLLTLGDRSTYKLNNAINHFIPINANYKVFKYFNFNTRINYKEYWNTQKGQITLDTLTNQKDTLLSSGFFATRSVDASAGLSTTLYGLFKFNGKRLKAMRHQLIANVDYVFMPDFTESQWNSYYLARLDTSADKETAQPYFFSSLGNNYAPTGNQGALRFSLNNNLEMKRRSKKDSGDYVKSPIIERLVLSSGYNFIADSFKLSPLSVSFATKILKEIQVVVTSGYSPYNYDGHTGQLIDQFLWNSSRGGLLRMTATTIGVTGTLNSKMFSGDEEDKSESLYLYTDYLSQYVDFDLPWSLSINYRHVINNRYDKEAKKYIIEQNPNLTFNGDFNLTQRWKFGYTFSYDFKEKEINYTTLNIYRDLHCWDLNIGAIPFGFHRSFNITLNVKAAVLQDLRINKRQDFIDNF